jgi:hypothetical protein
MRGTVLVAFLMGMQLNEQTCEASTENKLLRRPDLLWSSGLGYGELRGVETW